MCPKLTGLASSAWFYLKTRQNSYKNVCNDKNLSLFVFVRAFTTYLKTLNLIKQN